LRQAGEYNNKYSMKTWIAFLKAINVGGNNIIPMQELVSIGNGLGYDNFRTYIQSGNCIFSSTKTDPNEIATEMTGAIYKTFGFRPPVLAMPHEVLKKALELNPYKVESSEANKVHLHFLLTENAQFDEAEAKNLAIASEEFKLIDNILYLHAPDGIGRSKLLAKLPKLLSADVTVRNLRTVTKVYDLAIT